MSVLQDTKMAYDNAKRNVGKYAGSQASHPERYGRWVELMAIAERRLNLETIKFLERKTEGE